MSDNIHISSVSRSGQHAFCNWVCKNLPEKAIFHNEYKTLTGSMKVNRTGTTTYTKEQNPDLEATHVYLHENHIYENDGYVLLRDPYNWMASLLVSVERTEDELKQFILTYIELYQETIKHNKKNFLSYNKWFSDTEYKKALAKKMRLDSIERGVDDVVEFGNGSSFSQRKLDGRGSQLNVLNRYKTVLSGEHKNAQISPEEFKMVFLQNPKLIEIGSDLFEMDDIL